VITACLGVDGIPCVGHDCQSVAKSACVVDLSLWDSSVVGVVHCCWSLRMHQTFKENLFSLALYTLSWPCLQWSHMDSLYININIRC